MSERDFEADLKRALLLARNFRLHAVAQRLDPRAVRVAIKVMLKMDDHFALKKLTQTEELELEMYASRLAGEVIKQEEEKLKKRGQETTRQ